MSVTITILIGSYIPGYKAGGPVRSVENMIAVMGEFYNFRVITADRDLGDKKPYDSVIVNEWNIASDGRTRIFYATNWRIRRKIIKACNKDSDLFYICGILNNYALKFLLYKKRGIITKPIIIAPMGSLTNYALSVKKMKKQIYISLCNKVGLVKNIYWSASTNNELEEIRKCFLRTKKIYIMQDFVSSNKLEYMTKEKKVGYLKLIFISRIQPKKNLQYVLDIIKDIKGYISMSIYGSIEDKKYWEKCLDKIKALPDNIKVSYCGVLDSKDTITEYNQNHLFLFPTQSENFGHVIYESLCGGCPVIISDKTPWTQAFLGQAGIVLSLSNRRKFLREVQNYVDMDFEEYNTHAKAAYICSNLIYKKQQSKNHFKDMVEEIVADKRY